ncbi:F-box and WD repeat domain containing protein 10B isoform X2 [Mesoplodon densirostris]|uniref:F-box and WD repeat domain containing protein 10B isoform X2 n=1 Tax=Mesoplodon densirostris TaxID=48708 RepID=UPI0028DC9623|nr:F-box and WD repeat domain containing protein 10B isoform X2 [Mesoplodon densirostris]
MENMESRLKNVPYFRCEKGNNSVPMCQKCETCVLAWKIFSTKEWFRRVSKMSQRRFLVSILQQLDSLYLLHYFQNILQTTQGKDFIYHRSRVNLSKEGKIVKSSLNRMLDKTVEQKMREILYWFGNSSYRTKANYTLLLLQMCDPELLLTAVDVIRVLFLRGRNDASGNNPDSKDLFFVPEKAHTAPCETSQVCWAARPGHTSFPLSKTTGEASLHENVWWGAATTEGQWKSSLQYTSEMNRLSSEKASVSTAGSAPAADVLVDLEAVRELSSGVSRYRDFILHLPVHLSKYILSMLDKNSLKRCVFVSQHWAVLVQQVKTDLSMHAFIQHQITLLQGSYTRGIDPNYANKITVPVPKMADDGKHLCVKNQKWKLRTKNDYDLWTAYQNQETQQVQMEERNVFCGTYNIRILSDMWDRSRVIHYSGGDLLAVSSNRKIQLLDIIQIKQIPIKFQGHTGSVRTLFLCEEENFLLSGSYDLSIRYWDLNSGACVRIFSGHQGTITCMDVCKNKLASGAKDCQVKAWDIETGKCLKTFKHKDPILATRINDTYIVSSCEKGLVKVWHIITAQLVKTLNGHEGAVKCLCFDQWHLLSGSADGLVMAWSMVGKYERCLMAFKHPKMVINTEGDVLMFQFENIKWQYSLERAKEKKKDKEDDRGENGLTEVLSKSSTQIYSPQESISSKQTAQESLFSKSHRSPVLLRASRLPTGVLTEAPLSQGKPKSPRRVADDVEKIPKQGQLGTLGDLISCSKKKSWCIPMSPDQFLLTVNALQKAHNSGEFAYPRRPQTQVIDSWGPSISYPRKVLSLKGRSVQHAVDRLRLSNPPIDVKQTSIPLEIQKLRPNLKNSVHSPRVQSTIPQPVLICPRFSGSIKGEDTPTSSTDGAVNSFSPLTSTQVIKPNHVLAPPMGTTAQAAKKDWSRFYTALDPFRVNTEFMLLTVKEEKEYEEAKMKEFQAIKPAGGVDPEKASRAAWVRKIKGLPIHNFIKQGKTAAPELGQNVFI